MLVVLFHLSQMSGKGMHWPAGHAQAPLGWLYPVAWTGWVGVHIFFVLSGLLIAASAQGMAASNFLKKRAIRVLPALWISCVIALLARALWGERLSDIVPSFLRSLILSPRGPYIDGVIWTLVVEAAFYALVAGVISVASRWRLDRGMLVLALAMGTCSTLFLSAHWIATHTGLASSLDGLGAAMDRFLFDVLLLRHGVFFAIGILLFYLLENRSTGPVLATLAVFALAGCLQIRMTAEGLGNPLVPILVWAIATGLTFTSAKYGERLFDAERLRFSRQLGLMTYPLYLNHFILGQALIPLLASWLPNRVLLLGLALGLLLANAWFIAWGPERRLQRWARERLLTAPADQIPTGPGGQGAALL